MAETTRVLGDLTNTLILACSFYMGHQLVQDSKYGYSKRLVFSYSDTRRQPFQIYLIHLVETTSIRDRDDTLR